MKRPRILILDHINCLGGAQEYAIDLTKIFDKNNKNIWLTKPNNSELKNWIVFDNENYKTANSKQFNKWLESTIESNPIKQAWIKLNRAHYNKDTHQAFKQFLPQMLLLDATELDRLFALCFDQDNSINQSLKYQPLVLL